MSLFIVEISRCIFNISTVLSYIIYIKIITYSDTLIYSKYYEIFTRLKSGSCLYFSLKSPIVLFNISTVLRYIKHITITIHSKTLINLLKNSKMATKSYVLCVYNWFVILLIRHKCEPEIHLMGRREKYS